MLETRIADAFSQSLPSADISLFLDEIDAYANAQRRHEAASAKALDPATPPGPLPTRVRKWKMPSLLQPGWALRQAG